jgi:hypothetical protein
MVQNSFGTIFHFCGAFLCRPVVERRYLVAESRGPEPTQRCTTRVNSLPRLSPYAWSEYRRDSGFWLGVAAPQLGKIHVNRERY